MEHDSGIKITPCHRLHTYWFRAMTYPSCRRHIAMPDTVSLAAWRGEQPVGLLLAKIEARETAHLLSIFVHRDLRRRGIGRQLHTRMVEALFERGARSAHCTYMTGQTGIPFFECLLRSCRWTEPERHMLVLRSDLEHIAAASWMKLESLPAAYRIDPWFSLTSNDREALERWQAEERWIPDDDVSPFRHETGAHRESSLALRYQDRVVAWIINHRITDRLLRFTCSFAYPPLQARGRMIAVYAESIRRAKAAGIDQGTWTVPFAHASMIRFAERRLRPYATSEEETRRVSLTIG